MLEPIQAPQSINLLDLLNDQGRSKQKISRKVNSLVAMLDDYVAIEREIINHQSEFLNNIYDLYELAKNLLAENELPTDHDTIAKSLERLLVSPLSARLEHLRLAKPLSDLQAYYLGRKFLPLIASVQTAIEERSAAALKEKNEDLQKDSVEGLAVLEKNASSEEERLSLKAKLAQDLEPYQDSIRAKVREFQAIGLLGCDIFKSALRVAGQTPDENLDHYESTAESKQIPKNELEQAERVVNQRLQSNSEIKDILVFAKYQPLLKGSNAIRAKFAELVELLRNINLEAPQNLPRNLLKLIQINDEFFTLFDELVGKSKRDSQSDVVYALGDLIKKHEFPAILGEGINPEHLAAIASSLGTISGEAQEQKVTAYNQFASRLIPSNLRENIQPEDFVSKFAPKVAGYSANLTTLMSVMLGDGLRERFIDAQRQLEGGNAQRNANLDRYAQRAKQVTKIALKYDPFLSSLANNLVRIAESEQIRRAKPKLSSFAQLEQEAKSDRMRPSLDRRSLVEQASWKHQVARVKYSISAEELALLNKAANIELKPLILAPKYLGDQRQVYSTAIEKLNQEIAERKAQNQTGFRYWLPFLRRNTDRLEFAKVYLEYHAHKEEMTRYPERRMGASSLTPGKQREYFIRNKDTFNPRGKLVKRGFLSIFDKLTGFLSVFSSKDRALMKLNTLLQEKHSKAKELKQTYTKPLFNEDKGSRNQKAATQLETKGAFFDYPKVRAEHVSDFPKALFGNCEIDSLDRLRQKFAEHRLAIALESRIERASKQVNKELEEREVEPDMVQLPPDFQVAGIGSIEVAVIELENQLPDRLTQAGSTDTLLFYKRLLSLLKKHVGEYQDALYGVTSQLGLQEVARAAYMDMRQVSDEAISILRKGMPQLQSNDNYALEEDDYALNTVGKHLETVRDAKKALEASVDRYSRTLQALIDAKSDVLDILQAYNRDMGLEAIIPTIKAALENVVVKDRMFELDLTNKESGLLTAKRVNKLRNEEVGRELTGLLQKIQSEPAATAAIYKDTVARLTEEKYNLVTKAKYGEAGQLVNSYKQSVQALSYAADHMTDSLRGLRQ